MQVFELVKRLELDINFKGDTCRIQIEIFKHATLKRRFRCRLWRSDFYRLQPSFPQNKKGKPLHSDADEEFFVNWDFLLSRDYSFFEASTIEKAVQIVMCDLQANIRQSTARKSCKRRKRVSNVSA